MVYNLRSDAQADDGGKVESRQDLTEIQQKVFSIVRGYTDADIQGDQPLGMQGLDSLAFLELRQKLQVKGVLIAEGLPESNHTQIVFRVRTFRAQAIISIIDQDCRNSIAYRKRAMRQWDRFLTITVQDTFGLELVLLIEDPEAATLEKIVHEIQQQTRNAQHVSPVEQSLQTIVGKEIGALQAVWISRSPISIKLRIFCLPYAGGVSENVFVR